MPSFLVLLRRQILVSIGLSTACVGGKDDGECNPDEVDAMDPFVAPTESEGPSGQLYCVSEPSSAEACMACGADCFHEIASAFAAAHSYDVHGYDIDDECGPMWLEGRCCWAVSVVEWMEGRPFRVGGLARMAGLARREDWGTGGQARRDEGPMRARLAAHRARLAREEHASIASFSQAILELLALGAPAGLAAAAQRALGDEITHAKLAFGLASRYAGEALGPAPLPVGGALAAEPCPEALALATLRDGCINETLSAAEAHQAALACADPEVRAVLARIAEDEARHAALAWATLRWLLPRAALEAEALEALLESELLRIEASLGEGPGLPAHGLLGADAQREVLARTAAEILRPCLAALVGQAATARAAG